MADPLNADDLDPYSMPVSPTWNGQKLGEGGRFTRGNIYVREHHKIPRSDRVLEISCGHSVIAVVFPRGPSGRWRLQLLDEEQPLAPPDGGWPERTDLHSEAGEVPTVVDSGYGRHEPFQCVCARLHILDRVAIMAAADRLQPRTPRARARRIDFREVGSVVRDI